MRLGSGHLTSPSNKVSWNAARHRLELDRAKLPSRQILTYSLRDERHSGLGWAGAGEGVGGNKFSLQMMTPHSQPSQGKVECCCIILALGPDCYLGYCGAIHQYH